MKRLLFIFAIVAVFVILVVSGSVRRFVGYGNKGGKDKIVVHLTIQGGVCKAKDPVEDLGGSWLHKVEWTVYNDCPTAQYASFLEYQERLSGGGLGQPERGIVDKDPADSKQIAPSGTDKVQATITKLHISLSGDLVYKYKICAGSAPHPTSNCLDPDVDVWPF